MKLSKLVLIAALTVGGVCSAQAAPDTAAIAAKLQATAVSTSSALPPFDSKQEVKVYVKSLTPAEREALADQFADLNAKQQKALVKWYKNLPASPT